VTTFNQQGRRDGTTSQDPEADGAGGAEAPAVRAVGQHELVLWPGRFAGLLVVLVGCDDFVWHGEAGMALPVRVPRLTEQEGQKLQQIFGGAARARFGSVGR
jgi:hypothetical protein